MPHPQEHFTPGERERLRPYFTDLDAPVFGLVNLPETVKAAMFARYSRYPGTLRRLFLDEFADSVAQPAAGGAPAAQPGGDRASELFERIFVGYGDDSVAQLGGAHIACEWVSNVLTKILQRPRLAAYLEQSTRYIRFDGPMPGGGYRYVRDPELGPEYPAAMDALFTTYAQLLPQLHAWIHATFESPGPAAVRERAVRAKALDVLRGLLPAASLSHMGIYASGQAYEQLILHLLAHPLPEARRCGHAMLGVAKQVIPSFVARVERADRGGEWVRHLAERREAERRWAARLGLDRDDEAEAAPGVRLLAVDGTEDRLLAALLFEAAGVSEERALARVAQLGAAERGALLADLVGARANRRHRPGRGFEALRYRFEIVSDYGAFRDLQRHRLLTVQWQRFTPALGADIPEEVVAAGCADAYAGALERSAAEYVRLYAAGLREQAPYALCLGYRIRYVLDLNAREALHLIELRSGREGHWSYRAVAHAMHALIAERHPAVAAAMRHVDHSSEARLERLDAELRGERRRTVSA